MKLVIYEDALFDRLYPLTYMRPTFDLRCGRTLLREKIERAAGRKADALFVRDWLRDLCAARNAGTQVNDLAALQGDDLLIVNGRCLWVGDTPAPSGGDACGMVGDEIAYITLTRDTAKGISAADFSEFLDAAARAAPKSDAGVKLVAYPWNLVDENPAAVADDFAKLGKSGIEGTFSEQAAVWGPKDRLYVAPGAEVAPGAVIDTRHGPVMIGEGAVVNPMVRIEGPTTIGRNTLCFAAGRIHEGTSVGPVCYVGGEIEESIIHGYANKIHDGFLGHAYVCEWVNIGAGTTNSDLKNDYGDVEVYVKGRLMNTGSLKVGCSIGDHTKTSIGTMINTGTMIGVASNLLGVGHLLPKSVPSFVLFMEGKFFKVGIKQQIGTARKALGRRDVTMLPEEEALLKFLFDMTKEDRREILKKSRRQMLIEKGLR